MRWAIIFVIIAVVLTILLTGCSSLLNETEEVPVNLKCADIGGGAMMLGMTIDEAISETCKEACLNNVMKYSGSYKCDAVSTLLKCDCIITPERKEQLRTAENLQRTKSMEEASWKKLNPGKLTDNEVEMLCIEKCAGSNLQSYANNLNHNFFECQCRNEESYDIDYDTKQQISKDEVQRRIAIWQSKQQPTPSAVPELPSQLTIEDMWSMIKIGETAEDFDKQAQTAGFELVDPPWNSPHLEHFEIRRTNSNLEVIHVYFKAQAYNVYSSTGRTDPALPNNGLSWSPTNAIIYRKSLYHNGTQTRSEP